MQAQDSVVVQPAGAESVGGAGRDLFRAAFSQVLGDASGQRPGLGGLSGISAVRDVAARAHHAVSKSTQAIAERARAAASDAVESSLEQVVAFREDLAQYGYEMNGLVVKMSIVPEVEVEFLIHEGASLENFPEEEEDLTDIQRLLLHALERKASLDAMVAKNGMVFTCVKVVLTVPPSVQIALGFRGPPGASSDSSDGEGPHKENRPRRTRKGSQGSKGSSPSSRGSSTPGGAIAAGQPLALAAAPAAAVGTTGHIPSGLYASVPTRSLGAALPGAAPGLVGGGPLPPGQLGATTSAPPAFWAQQCPAPGQRVAAPALAVQSAHLGAPPSLQVAYRR